MQRLKTPSYQIGTRFGTPILNFTINTKLPYMVKAPPLLAPKNPSQNARSLTTSRCAIHPNDQKIRLRFTVCDPTFGRHNTVEAVSTLTYCNKYDVVNAVWKIFELYGNHLVVASADSLGLIAAMVNLA